MCFALNGGGGGGFSQLLALIHAIFEEVLQVPDLPKPRLELSRRFLHDLQLREEKLTLENRRRRSPWSDVATFGPVDKCDPLASLLRGSKRESRQFTSGGDWITTMVVVRGRGLHTRHGVVSFCL